MAYAEASPGGSMPPGSGIVILLGFSHISFVVASAPDDIPCENTEDDSPDQYGTEHDEIFGLFADHPPDEHVDRVGQHGE